MAAFGVYSQALFRVHAMGFGVWGLLICGALIGQLSVVIPVTIFGTGPSISPASLESSVARAVSETLKFCAELDLTSSTLPPSASVIEGAFQLNWIAVIGLACLGVSVLICGVCTVGWYLLAIRARHLSVAAVEGDSPKSPQLALQTLARNQLAELRVRRHAGQSNRFA